MAALRGTRGERMGVGRAMLAAVAVVAASCTTPGSTDPLPPPELSVWITGDSLAAGTAEAMQPRPYSVVSGGAGFTVHAPGMIFDNTEEHIGLYGQPDTLLVLGGVADAPKAETPEIIAGMEEFKAAMLARGIRLIWIAQPAYIHIDKVEILSTWMLGQPESIDCRIHAGWSIDGVHPVDYSYFARCIDAAVAAMGVEFTLPVPNP